MAGKIIYTHKKFDEDKDISELSYVNDINYPYKYSVRVFRNGYSICYIASEHELDFSINDYNSAIDSVVIAPKNVDSTNIKGISVSGNTYSGSISSWYVVADVENEKDAEVRKGLVYFDSFSFDMDDHINESITPLSISYSVIPSEYLPIGSSFTLIEKINGEIFRTLENQIGEIQCTINLSDIWDNIGYKENTIEIIATSSIDLSSTTCTTFRKIKELTKPISTESNLKEFVDLVGNIENDIDYLRCRLFDNLIEKGVECSDTDKMSSLIDKIGTIFTSNKVTISDNDMEFITPKNSATTYYANSIIFNRRINVFGSIRVKTGIYSNSSSTSSLTFELIRGKEVIKSNKFSNNNVLKYFEIDYDVLPTDILKIYVSESASGVSLYTTSIKYDYV